MKFLWHCQIQAAVTRCGDFVRKQRPFDSLLLEGQWLIARGAWGCSQHPRIFQFPVSHGQNALLLCSHRD
jgi:hypothetical protein